MMKSNELITGLIAGVAMGVAAGLLFAPIPGKESWNIVADRTGKLRHKTGGYVDVIRSWRKNKVTEPALVGPFEWRCVSEAA